MKIEFIKNFQKIKKMFKRLQSFLQYKRPQCAWNQSYVITLIGSSSDSVDKASLEIKKIAENKGANVLIISNMNFLVDNMKELKYNLIINKSFGTPPEKLDHLARFIRNSVWHPWMFYVDDGSIIKNEINLEYVNQIYQLKSTNEEKRKNLELYFM